MTPTEVGNLFQKVSNRKVITCDGRSHAVLLYSDGSQGKMVVIPHKDTEYPHLKLLIKSKCNTIYNKYSEKLDQTEKGPPKWSSKALVMSRVDPLCHLICSV